MDLDQIGRRTIKSIRRHFQAKESQFETDPVTLSRGLVLERLGPGHDKWGRDVHLVYIRVLKKNEHHQKDDEVIWEIPTEEELKMVMKHGVHSRIDLLRLWLCSPRSSTDAGR